MADDRLVSLIRSGAFGLHERPEEYAGVELDLRGAELRGVDLVHCDLRGAHLASAQLQDALLMECNLSGAHLEGVRRSWERSFGTPTSRTRTCEV